MVAWGVRRGSTATQVCCQTFISLHRNEFLSPGNKTSSSTQIVSTNTKIEIRLTPKDQFCSITYWPQGLEQPLYCSFYIFYYYSHIPQEKGDTLAYQSKLECQEAPAIQRFLSLGALLPDHAGASFLLSLRLGRYDLKMILFPKSSQRKYDWMNPDNLRSTKSPQHISRC